VVSFTPVGTALSPGYSEEIYHLRSYQLLFAADGADNGLGLPGWYCVVAGLLCSMLST